MIINFKKTSITLLAVFVMSIFAVIAAPIFLVKAEGESVTSTVTVTNANIVKSGTFDNGKTGDELKANTSSWSVNSVVCGEEAYSGYSLKIVANNAAGGTCFSYGADNVMADIIKANTPYKMSYLIKVTNAESGFNVSSYFQPDGNTSTGRLIFGTDDNTSTYKLDITGNTDGWVCKTAYFVTGKEIPVPRLGFRYKGTGTIYIDNVTLVEDDNYIVDGNMETTYGWNGATISEEGGYFGKGIVSVGAANNDSKDYFVTTPNLVTGESYVATAKVKVSGRGPGCNVSLRVYRFPDGETMTEVTNDNTRAIFTKNTDGWATARVEFVAGAQASTRWHRIQFTCNGINTTYIDEVRVIKKSEDTQVSTSLLSEGFEGESLNAEIIGDKGSDVLDFGYGRYGNNARIDHFAASGEKSYAFTLNKDIPLTVNGEKCNTLKVKYSFNSGSGVSLLVRLVNGDDVIKEVPIGSYATCSGWLDAEAVFTLTDSSPESAKLQIICEFMSTDTTLLLDKFYAEGTLPAAINVTFDESKPQTVKEGKTVIKPEDPVKVGYKFDGWFKGDELYDFERVITDQDQSFDLTSKFSLDLSELTEVTADGLKLANGEQVYKTTKNENGSVEALYLNKTEAQDIVLKFEKEKQVSGITFDYLIYGSITNGVVNYIGKDGITKTTKSVTMADDGAWHSVTLGASDDFSALEITLDGFEGEALIANVNLTLKTYNVRFVDQNGSLLSETFAIVNGETVPEDKIPETHKEGYEFICWMAAGEEFTKDSIIMQNLTISAKYVKFCTISVIDSNGEQVKTFTLKEGEEFELSQISDILPEKAADDDFTYTFNGWSVGGKAITDKFTVEGDATIEPEFTSTAIEKNGGIVLVIVLGSVACLLAVAAVFLIKFLKKKKVA